MKGLNIKELCKQIKKSKHNMIWTRKDGYHYVTNRYWMVRFSEVPREVLITLFTIFAAIPEEGRALIMSFGNLQEREHIGTDGIYDKLGTSLGEITSFIKDSGEIKMRVITSGASIIYVNDEFIKLLDWFEQPKCAGVLHPLSFFDGSLILLPYRTAEAKEDSTLKDLLAS